jgi:phosphohistidine phosphatase
MKTLILLRHAKSDWGSGLERDHERPLNSRGQRSAETVGRFLELSMEVPAGVVTSSAVRARTTVELAAEAGGWSCPVEVTNSLYEATPEAVLKVIQERPDAQDSLLLAGHEPTWSRLVERFTGGRAKIVTATLVRIDFSVAHWREVRFAGGTLVWLVSPKLLERAGLGGPSKGDHSR